MCPCCAHVTCSSWLRHWIQGPPLSHTLWNFAQHFSLTVKLQLAHSGSSVVTCPFPAYSDPWDIFVATCSLRRCSLSGEILVPTSERLREGKREERKDPSLCLYRRFQWPPSPRIDWPLVTCIPPLPSPSQWILGSSDLWIQWLPPSLVVYAMGRDSREWVSGLTAHKTPPYLVLIKHFMISITFLFPATIL